jgi:CBS domain-containing protein
MTPAPSTCRLDTPLDDASRLMNEAHCGTLVVLDNRGHPVGILTDRDLAISIGKTTRRASEVFARDAMTSPVHTCGPDESVMTALDRMSDARIRRLPVVDSNGALNGVVSIDDIVLWGVEHGGVARKPLMRALRTICSAHERLLSTETLDEPLTVASSAD